MQTNKMGQQLKPQRPPGPQKRLPWLTPSFIGGPPRSAPGPPLGHVGPLRRAPGPPLGPPGPSHGTARPQRPPGPTTSFHGPIRKPPGPPNNSSGSLWPPVVLNSKSHSRDEMRAALLRQESQRSRKTLRPPASILNSSQKKKKTRPPGSNKQQITVSQTCRFLELNDYPLAFGNHSSEFLADFDAFSRFYLPLVASVNPGRSRLRVETLVRAKWLGLGFKSGPILGNLGQSKAISGAETPTTAPQAHSSFFRKPRGNKIRLNVSR